ncbi:MAG TPA: ATPase [Actinomycetaceae bacterium]|nr:ATPase [Actinomycetaceae bacterium]
MTDQPTKGESLLAILDELAQVIRSAKAMPMSASVLVNKAEALALLDAARQVVPEQIAEADEIVAGAQQLVQRANEKAAQLQREAEERAKELVEKESLVEAAKVRADEIIAEAEVEGRKLADESNDYADRQLAQLEIELGQIAKQVEAGRAVIQARLTTGDNRE